MKNKKERLKELDILRGLAFMFVVVQHTIGGFSNVKGIRFFDYSILKFLYVIAKTAVPLFLFISAISLFYVNYEKINLKQFYIKKLKYIVIPYVIWSAVNIYMLNNRECFNDFFMEIIAGNGAYHLWYMGMILRLYILFPIIFITAKKIHNSNFILRIFVFITLIAIYYNVNKYNNVISNSVSKFLFSNPTGLQNRIVNISFIFWYLYFVIGIYTILNYKYIKEKLLSYKFIILNTYILILIYTYINEIYPERFKFVRGISISYYIFSLLTFYIISVLLSRKLKFYRLMNFFSKYSFGAYMVHVIFIGTVVQNLRLYFHVKNYVILGILTWILVCFFSAAFIKFISYIPFSHYITGTKTSKIDIFNYKFQIKIWKKTENGGKIICAVGNFKEEFSK
jgi:surface polysaccharide O-acyltransferase-like enzyme